MKYRMIALLLAVCLVSTLLPVPGVWAEEEMELFFSENELVQDKSEESGEQDPMEDLKDMNAAIMEALGKKDWEELAAKVSLTGDWRDDLVNVAESQIGYQEEKDGMTHYTRWAGLTEAADWSALFVNWVAAQVGLNSKEFPQGATYEALRSGMSSVKAVKSISRSTYPTAGDLALIETNGQKLVGIVVYVSNDYASVIHGDDNGRVTKETYYVGGSEFKNYVDLNVLMERACIEIGKGGNVPEIPEGGVAAWTNTNAVYMRSEPTMASKSLTTIKKARTALLVTSAEMQADGYIWYGVEYQKYTGYIRGNLVELDLAALPTATPAPTKKPEATATPGCVYCAGVANGVALPMECCYEHLKALGAEYAAPFMSALKEADETMWDVYTKCHAAHVDAGEAAIIPMNGLTMQERVVNIEVRETEAGQETMIFFDIYGANAYQWHEVKSVVNEDGTVTETDTIIEGEKSAAVVVTAKNEANTTYSYYCVATIVANGTKVDVASKSTVLNVGDVAVTADAILGEEINFTYTVEGAAAYQWYESVTPEGSRYVTTTAIAGATEPTLALIADPAKVGALYYCIVRDSNGSKLRESGRYSYTINTTDLAKYVDELANMTLDKRYTAMNQTWSSTAYPALAEDVYAYWVENLSNVYPTLLCTCGKISNPFQSHNRDCAWYVPGGQQSGCSDFDEECAIVTSWVTRNAPPMEIYNYLASLESAAYDKLLPHVHAAHQQAERLLCSCMDMYTTLVVPGQLHDDSCAWYLSEEELDELDRTNATDYTYGEDGNSVNLKVAEGVFAEAYVMEIDPIVPSDETLEAVLNSMDATGTAKMQLLQAFDITFASLADRSNKLQPLEGQSVALTFDVSTANVPADDTYYLYVYHIADDGTPEVVAGPVEVAYGEQQIEVNAEAFSVYAVVLTTDACAFCTENENCVYEDLIVIPAYGQYSVLNMMSEAELKAFLSDYQKHVKRGDPELLCSCEDGLMFGNIKAPGAEHDADCPWFEKHSVTVDVIGFPVTLSYPNNDMMAGSTYQWYKDNMETGMLIGETKFYLDVTIPVEPEMYYLLVGFPDQSEELYTYYVAPQTTVLGLYIDYLLTMMESWTQTYEEYVDFAYEYITDTCDFEVVGEDGNVYCLADAILSYWYQTSNEWTAPLLCSCVISGAVESDEIMLHPDALHDETCPWCNELPILRDEATGITVTGDIPEGVQLVVTPAAKPSIETLITMIDPSKYAEEPNVLAYDITLMQADGTAWQPTTAVTVTVPGAYTTVPEKPLAEAVHMTGDTTFEVLPATANDDGSVTFEAESFSTYYVVAGTQSESLGNDEYYILPGASVNITSAGTTKPTVTDENGVTVEEPSWLEIKQSGRTTSITVSPTAPTDKTYSLKYSNPNRTVTIHIVPQQVMVEALLEERPNIYFTIIEDSSNVPTEPMSGGSFIYYYLGTNNRGDVTYNRASGLSTNFGVKYSTNAASFFTSSFQSAPFIQSIADNANVMGVVDTQKVGSLRGYINGNSEEFWHGLLMGLAEHDDNQSTTTVTVTTVEGNKSLAALLETDPETGDLFLNEKLGDGTYRYKLMPFVIKVLIEQSNWIINDSGWHIDCCIVDTLTYSVSYYHNLPDTVTLPNDLYVPATKFYAPGSEPPVEAMTSDSAGKNPIKSIKVYDNLTQGDVTYTFQGWDSDGDGRANYQPDDNLEQLEGNVELVAIWTTSAESGTIRLTKQEDFTKAPGHTLEGAGTEYEFTITYPAGDSDSEPPAKRPYSIETPNSATVRGEFAAGAREVTIKIKHDQTLILHNVAPGTVTITETVDASYTPSWTGAAAGETPNVATAVVEAGNTTSVVCTNTYAPSKGSLIITKTVTGTPDGESFIFHVTGPDYDGYVTIKFDEAGTKEVKLTDLKLGTYTVTETSWSFRYTQTGVEGLTDGKIEVTPNGATVHFTNAEKPEKWLHDEYSVHNDFSK